MPLLLTRVTAIVSATTTTTLLLALVLILVAAQHELQCSCVAVSVLCTRHLGGRSFRCTIQSLPLVSLLLLLLLLLVGMVIAGGLGLRIIKDSVVLWGAVLQGRSGCVRVNAQHILDTGILRVRRPPPQQHVVHVEEGRGSLKHARPLVTLLLCTLTTRRATIPSAAAAAVAAAAATA